MKVHKFLIGVNDLSDDFVWDPNAKKIFVDYSRAIRDIKTLNNVDLVGEGNITLQQIGAEDRGTANSLMSAHNALPDPHGQYVLETAPLILSLNGERRVVYEGEVVASEADAFFTLNFPANYFAEPPRVFITGFALNGEANTAVGNAAFACLFPSSITTTRARGRVKTANSAGLLAAMVLTNAAGAIVQFIAIGKPKEGAGYV